MTCEKEQYFTEKIYTGNWVGSYNYTLSVSSQSSMTYRCFCRPVVGSYEKQSMVRINLKTAVYDYKKDDVLSIKFFPGEDAVDLGLSVKWAQFNLGSNEPFKPGDYYAWGETSTKTTYDWSTYAHCSGTNTTMTKYCTNDYYGTVDGKTTLDPADDAATANLGDGWRMPTFDEWLELSKNCKKKWTTMTRYYMRDSTLWNKKINGVKVTASNRNYIFFPTGGYIDDSSVTTPKHTDYYIYLWSSNNTSSSNRAIGFRMDEQSVQGYSVNWDTWFHDGWYDSPSTYDRSYGHNIRPVKP